MQGIEADAENVEPRVTVDADGGPRHGRGLQRAADAASAVSRALSAAGYEPNHLSVTSSESGELVLVARLHHRSQVARSGSTSIGVRLAIGLTLGVLLGFLGLPRLELPAAAPAAVVPTPALPQIISVQDLAASGAPKQTPPAQPTPNVAPTVNSILFDAPVTSPVTGWTNDPAGTAWFGVDGYRLYARDAGRFVATAIPLGRPVQDISISAAFHKIGGPVGGGYGFILRDQSPSGDRDGRNQSGRYLVAEVGDRGDIGVWQRDDTHWIDIVPWQRSEAVHTDRASNSLAVTARGSRIVFDVNGQTVADLTYDKLPDSGGVGIFVGGDLNEVTLERLRIANPN